MGAHFVAKTAFLFVDSTEQKTLLDAPVILSHSKAVLDAHAQSSDFCNLTWLKLSGAL